MSKDTIFDLRAAWTGFSLFGARAMQASVSLRRSGGERSAVWPRRRPLRGTGLSLPVLTFHSPSSAAGVHQRAGAEAADSERDEQGEWGGSYCCAVLLGCTAGLYCRRAFAVHCLLRAARSRRTSPLLHSPLPRPAAALPAHRGQRHRRAHQPRRRRVQASEPGERERRRRRVFCSSLAACVTCLPPADLPRCPPPLCIHSVSARRQRVRELLVCYCVLLDSAAPLTGAWLLQHGMRRLVGGWVGGWL